MTKKKCYRIMEIFQSSKIGSNESTAANMLAVAIWTKSIFFNVLQVGVRKPADSDSIRFGFTLYPFGQKVPLVHFFQHYIAFCRIAILLFADF